MKCSEFKVKYEQSISNWNDAKEEYYKKLMNEVYPQSLEAVLEYACTKRKSCVPVRALTIDGCIKLYVGYAGHADEALEVLVTTVDFNSEYISDSDRIRTLAALLKAEFKSDGYIVDVGDGVMNEMRFELIISGWA